MISRLRLRAIGRVHFALIGMVLIFFIAPISAQDREYVSGVIGVLASDSMGGRGYRGGADLRAAEYIRDEFIRHGVAPLGKDYFQSVVFPVNSITEVLVCEVDGVLLEPGSDFYISVRSRGRFEDYALVWVDRSLLESRRRLQRLVRSDLSGSLLVLAPEVSSDPDMRDLFRELFLGRPSTAYRTNAAGIVWCQDRPGWQISDGGTLTDYLVLTVRCGLITRESRRLTIGFTHEYNRSYVSHNVAGMVQGTVYPDSFIVFTAHYDHLGMMGDVVLPGANDNASGTAMILDLALHYAANPPAWSVAFLAFTAEEAGLIGSFQYVKNPMFPLKQIGVLINLDMVGTGSEGITVVNGSVHQDDFALLDSINSTDSLLAEVRIRGASPNSDHHPFDEKGVKSFFIYTMGPEHREYHTIYDRAEAVPLTAYDELFLLLTRYVGIYMR
jgi:aminopeptidase YwaD